MRPISSRLSFPAHQSFGFFGRANGTGSTKLGPSVGTDLEGEAQFPGLETPEMIVSLQNSNSFYELVNRTKRVGRTCHSEIK